MRAIADLDELMSLVTDLDGVFLRYSEGPESDQKQGHSLDYEAEVRLPGWAVTTIHPEPWWSRPAKDWVARRVCKYLDLGTDDDDRQPWLLTGTVVAIGPDHEPLVDDMRFVAWLGPRVVDEARHIYQTRFRVGRDSAGST